MKKIFFGALLLACLSVVPLPAAAATYVNVGIGLPPPMAFAGPPQMIVLPGTNVYVVPDVMDDIYFQGGWWWRLWGGHWYRSRYYDSGWAYYRHVPAFYRGVPPGWRTYYRDRVWMGHPWNYQRIPHHDVHRNWQHWERDRHWERQQHWGVPGLQSQPRSQFAPRDMQPRPQQPAPLRQYQPAPVQQHLPAPGQQRQYQPQGGAVRQGPPHQQQFQPQQQSQPQGRPHQQHGHPQGAEEEQRRGR